MLDWLIFQKNIKKDIKKHRYGHEMSFEVKCHCMSEKANFMTFRPTPKP